mmetsp:Transcript_79240/g.246748  ORF Transcript_79240/g.246748 Transcript_79240/m.246748 type:complete len:248 (-) Transcript_79240:1267-2010(-)
MHSLPGRQQGCPPAPGNGLAARLPPPPRPRSAPRAPAAGARGTAQAPRRAQPPERRAPRAAVRLSAATPPPRPRHASSAQRAPWRTSGRPPRPASGTPPQRLRGQQRRPAGRWLSPALYPSEHYRLMLRPHTPSGAPRRCHSPSLGARVGTRRRPPRPPRSKTRARRAPRWLFCAFPREATLPHAAIPPNCTPPLHPRTAAPRGACRGPASAGTRGSPRGGSPRARRGVPAAAPPCVGSPLPRAVCA